jgi:CheY-like chemotaxis protein
VALATILVVDDIPDVLELTATVLEEAGYGVICCRGSREALAVLGDGHNIDLLVTDITMPGIDGLELARQARAQRPLLPVLYLTAYAELLADKTQVVLGPILRKPYRVAEFARQVEALLLADENARLVRAVAAEMIERCGDALQRAKEAKEIARLSGDDLSATAWRDIADGISHLRRGD